MSTNVSLGDLLRSKLEGISTVNVYPTESRHCESCGHVRLITALPLVKVDRELVQFLKTCGNNKVAQIKFVRYVTGWGLKETKEVVEAIHRGDHDTL